MADIHIGASTIVAEAGQQISSEDLSKLAVLAYAKRRRIGQHELIELVAKVSSTLEGTLAKQVANILAGKAEENEIAVSVAEEINRWSSR